MLLTPILMNRIAEATELGICIINGKEQIDFGFSLSETDQLIGFLKGLIGPPKRKKHNTARQDKNGLNATQLLNMPNWTDILPSLFGGKGLITEIKDFAGEFIHTKEDQQKFEIGLTKLAMDKSQMYLQDVASARQMYMKDNTLQKLVALVLLSSYLTLTIILLIGGYMLAMNQLELPAWYISLISAIWGAFTTKVSTIVDFLFGSSEGSKEKARAMEAQINKIQEQAGRGSPPGQEIKSTEQKIAS